MPLRHISTRSLQSVNLPVESPVPGFVVDAVWVIAWVRESETVSAGMLDQPRISVGGLEAHFQRRGVRRGEIEGAAGVMFAVARRGVDLEDVRDLHATIQLALDERALVFDA